jgi:hypothetical protein
MTFDLHSRLTSDHGDLLGEHGKLNKGRPFRTSAGVPFILRYPAKVPAGKNVQSATSSIDFAPSILSLMGAGDHGVSFDGSDFSDEVTSSYTTTNYLRTKYTFDSPGNAHWAAVIRRNLKLVISRTDVPWLYDLNADPFEVENMFDKPKYATSREALLNSIYHAMEDHDIPLKFATRYIFWSTPACIDSNDRIKIDSENFTCQDIGSNRLPFEKCKEQGLSEHCPVTCQSCCEDSVGKMWVDGFLRGCDELVEKKCDKVKVQKFCPLSCGTCRPNDESVERSSTSNNIFAR